MRIRSANIDDLPEILSLFERIVRNISEKHYNKKQVEIWVSSAKNTQPWKDRIKNQFFLVAEFGGKIIGFGSLEGNEYLDLMYVDENHQRKGIATKLYKKLEQEALRLGSKFLTSDVSRNAATFFKRMEFTKIKENKNIVNGIEILNYKMTKNLTIQS